jgi:hypothetical protein
VRRDPGPLQSALSRLRPTAYERYVVPGSRDVMSSDELVRSIAYDDGKHQVRPSMTVDAREASAPMADPAVNITRGPR